MSGHWRNQRGCDISPVWAPAEAPHWLCLRDPEEAQPRHAGRQRNAITYRGGVVLSAVMTWRKALLGDMP